MFSLAAKRAKRKLEFFWTNGHRYFSFGFCFSLPWGMRAKAWEGIRFKGRYTMPIRDGEDRGTLTIWWFGPVATSMAELKVWKK